MKTLTFTFFFTSIICLGCTTYAFYAKSEALIKQNVVLEKKLKDARNEWDILMSIRIYDEDPIRKVESKTLSSYDVIEHRRIFIENLSKQISEGKTLKFQSYDQPTR